MASAYKPGGRRTCRIEFTDQHGKRQIKGTKIRDRRVAQQLAAQVEADAARIRAGQLPLHLGVTGPYLDLAADRRQTPLAEALAAYLADLERRRKSPATVRHRRYKVTRLAHCCGWKTLADITPAMLTPHLAVLPSPATANAYRDALNAFLCWCLDQGYLVANPIERVRRSEGSTDRPFRRRAFLPEELQQLLDAAPKQSDRYLVAALTGLRAHELSLIEARDFDQTARVWTCRAEVDKGKRVWRLPLLPDALPVLERLCQGQGATERLFPRRLGNGTFNAHLKRAGLTKIGADGRRLNFHSLRYTFCTLCARHMPVQIVQRLMRHADIRRTVNLYLDLGLDDLAQAVAELPSLFGDQKWTTAKNPGSTRKL